MVAHGRGSNRPRAAELASAPARGRGEARSAPVRLPVRAGAPTPLHPPVPASLRPVRRPTGGVAAVCGGALGLGDVAAPSPPSSVLPPDPGPWAEGPGDAAPARPAVSPSAPSSVASVRTVSRPRGAGRVTW